MQWDIKAKITSQDKQQRLDAIIDAVFANRGLSSHKARQQFLHPADPLTIAPHDVGIDSQQLAKSIDRINIAIAKQTPIVIYGDYDADGITATAILWETLTTQKARVFPFIPNRELHGYGLSIKGLQAALANISQSSQKPLIITVDNGITAFEAAQWVADQGFDLILTDHHQKSSQLPQHYSLVHTDQVAGSAVAWFLAKELSLESAQKTLELAAIGTITDLLPLHEANRSIVKFGLPLLQHTRRPGLLAMYQEAGLDQQQEFTPYQVGFVIGPRLNAMGRLEDAMDSLRLLCTNNLHKAEDLARLLADTNRARQDLTFEFVDKAHGLLTNTEDHILIVDDQEFHEGVIGLIAGKLSEKYYRPSIVISRGQTISKASARSVRGVNIIELIRTQESLLVNAGGHPQAAGFTIETNKLLEFRQNLISHANQFINKELLSPQLDIDCELMPTDVDWDLYELLSQLKPFGMKNSEPVFALRQVKVINANSVGKDNRHLKLTLGLTQDKSIGAIGFGMGDQLADVLKSGSIDIAFCLDQNTWNGKTSLQIRVKDISTK